MKINPPEAKTRITISIFEYKGAKQIRNKSLSLYETTFDEVFDLVMTAIKSKAEDAV